MTQFLCVHLASIITCIYKIRYFNSFHNSTAFKSLEHIGINIFKRLKGNLRYLKGSFHSKSLIAKELLKNRCCLKWYLKSSAGYNLWSIVLRTMLPSWNLSTFHQSQWESVFHLKHTSSEGRMSAALWGCEQRQVSSTGSPYSEKLLSTLIFHLFIAVALFCKLQFWVPAFSKSVWQKTQWMKNYSIGLNLHFPLLPCLAQQKI